MSEIQPKTRVHSIQLAGLLLWRGGLLLAAGWTLFEIARLLLRYIDLPAQLEVGLALVSSGLALVVGSYILERRQDYLAEGDLLE